MTATCFTCHTTPAGHPASPYSAYCAPCQPVATGPAPRGSECECGTCHAVFASMTLFDAHTPGVCVPVQGLGAVQDARGTWVSQEGLKARERLRTRLELARRSAAAVPS
jgi:hypothetical protein